MNALQSLLSHPAVMRLGWALIHFLWQGAAVAALLALTLLLLRRATANARYLAACGALLLMTAAPVLTCWHLAPPPGSPQRASAGLPELPDIARSGNVAVSAPAAGPSAARVSPKPLPVLPPAAPRPWHARAMHWIEANLRWFVGAWFCGVLCLSIRLLFGWSGVRRIRRSGVVASETLQNRLKDLARKLRVARPVRLVTSAIADAPVVIGWFRPVILFPASVLTQLSPQQLEAILAHELAHVRRHDYLVNLFQTVVETLLFYHPAVHWVSHRMRVEREHCCDDLAVSACGDSAFYARALARLAEMSVAAPRLVPAAGGQLLGRIRRLLSADVRCDRRASVWVGGTVLIAALLACVIALGASKAGGAQKAEGPAANGGATVTPLDDYSRMRELPATDDELRAPTPEEIRKFGPLWPDVPPEQNAACYFAKAAKAVAPFEDRPDGSLRGIEPYAGNVAAFEKWVELNQPAFKLMREGLKQKVYRPIFLISKKEGQPVPDVEFLAAVRNLARTCADAGFLAELQHRPDAAAEEYAECLQLGTALRQHGPLIQELVGFAVMAIGQRNMDALVATGGLNEAALRTVIRQCREAEVRSDEPATCWATEVAYGEVLMSLEKNPAGKPIFYDQWRKQRAALSRIIEKNTLPQLLQRDVAKEIAEIGTKEPGAVPDPILQPIVRAFAELGRLDVRLRATEIRAAIALYQKTHGAPPDSLDALCPDMLPSMPIDPFSGKPMHYARTETGWKVWSVGDSNVDHGGVSDETPEVLRRGQVWKGPDYVYLSDIDSNLELRSTMGKAQSVSLPPGSSSPASTEKPAANGVETATPLDAYSRMLEVRATNDELRAPTPEEIKELGPLWPDVPPEQNAAYYFAKAAKALAPSDDAPDGSSSTSEPYAGNVAAFEKWVEINQPAFKLMREGLDQKVCRPVFLIWKKGGQPVADFAFLAHVRQLARTCTDAGFLAELQRRPNDAAKAYAECLQMGILLRQHSVLIQELVGISVSGVGEMNLDPLIANGGLDEAALRAIIRQCREAEVHSDEPATCWATEIAYGEVLMSLEKNPAGKAIVYGQWRRQRAALSRIIEQNTLPQLLQQNTAKEIAEIGTKEPGAVPDLLIPPVVRALSNLGKLDVRLRATEIRAAIALYQKAHDAPPDSLDALSPDILPSAPMDPFSGKPMRYARTETGWKVWSVGEDNVDHGGVSDETPEALRRGQGWNGPDYVFLSDIASNLERRSTRGKPQSASPPPGSSAPASTEKPKENPGSPQTSQTGGNFRERKRGYLRQYS